MTLMIVCGALAGYLAERDVHMGTPGAEFTRPFPATGIEVVVIVHAGGISAKVDTVHWS